VLASCAEQVVEGVVQRRQAEQDARATKQMTGSRSRAAVIAATTRKAGDLVAAAQAALAKLDEPDPRTPAENADLGPQRTELRHWAGRCSP